jgi:hypothetical protein
MACGAAFLKRCTISAWSVCYPAGTFLTSKRDVSKERAIKYGLCNSYVRMIGVKGRSINSTLFLRACTFLLTTHSKLHGGLKHTTEESCLLARLIACLSKIHANFPYRNNVSLASF